jgi:hypothetical protein
MSMPIHRLEADRQQFFLIAAFAWDWTMRSEKSSETLDDRILSIRNIVFFYLARVVRTY